MSSKIFILMLIACLALEKADTASSPEKYIKLAIGVSKAAYLPLSGRRYIQNGYIIENHLTTKPFTPYEASQDRISCGIGRWSAKHHEKRETEVLLFKHAKQKLAVFGFRGTEPTSLEDWVKNFRVRATEVRIGSEVFKIHRGFSDRYQDISSWFESEYEAIPQNYTIIITGHSLGGAMATIAAAYAYGTLNRHPDAVITFGSPKVGDDDFRTYYREYVRCSNTVRVTAKNDIIPTVPIRYKHVCDALEVDGQTRLLEKVQIVKNHDLYHGYDRGLAKKYKDLKVYEINYGCDPQM